jgi:hypothetical protein
LWDILCLCVFAKEVGVGAAWSWGRETDRCFDGWSIVARGRGVWTWCAAVGDVPVTVVSTGRRELVWEMDTGCRS